MANIKELRLRIKSVANIAKITRAMEMVASMKLRKVQGRALGFRPYTEEIRSMLGRVSEAGGEEVDSPLFETRSVKTTGVFVVTSDRGLCGAYNTNVFAAFHRFERELLAQHPDRKIKLYVVGRKGASYFTRRGYDIAEYFAEPPLEKCEFGDAHRLGEALVKAFASGEVDEVHACYTSFVTAARFQACVKPFVPLTSIDAGAASDGGAASTAGDYLLEPDPQTLLDRLIPKYLETVVFDIMLSSLASEFASRRMAMKGATDAASRMGKELKRVYNRARQDAITKDLLDIIGGASAVA